MGYKLKSFDGMRMVSHWISMVSETSIVTHELVKATDFILILLTKNKP